MADKLHVSLVTPEKELFAGDVDQVIAPGSEGEFGVLAGHAPLMTTLTEGTVTILNGDQKRMFQVIGGFADVNAEGITILAERAEEYIETVH
ncbi:ATP synthase F1 subunit epsilon [Asticcacaulis sp. DW145]|jgi:F-type H+-transporting ATPase subunit epsilon|uniref:ATP synthase epsilon chain n=1 Tax=Asticcacaulis currens TaxID=2984210 RepID=A0ABT5IB08_9CAUL|nr:ATP synthase F1 subunit epsilon [Asticcacaulis currens]MDC7693148.1 ATP synthase F1 subunit epsilon [Asticcacaulis currens]BEV09740.1 ATP synthase F1 subunit epsilon [Asticcacaulis sp. DW145]